jgi:hypothetical protein
MGEQKQVVMTSQVKYRHKKSNKILSYSEAKTISKLPLVEICYFDKAKRSTHFIKTTRAQNYAHIAGHWRTESGDRALVLLRQPNDSVVTNLMGQ